LNSGYSLGGGNSPASSDLNMNSGYSYGGSASAQPAVSTFPNISVPANDPRAVTALINANGSPRTADNSTMSGVRSTDSPAPLDDPNNPTNRTHFTSDEALAWYKQNIDTDAQKARQEFDPQTGMATNRNIITLKDGTQQPVHSAYISANPGIGDWMSDLNKPTNPALAANPANTATALAGPASYGTSQQIQQKLNSSAGLSPQDILNQGGPLQASNGQQAGTVSTDPTPYRNAQWLNRPSGLPSAPQPSATILPGAPAPKPAYQARSPEGDATDDAFWLKNYGMTADQFRQRATDPQTAKVIGTGEINASGIASPKVEVTGLDGTKHVAFIDPSNGMPYTVQAQTLTSEHRDYMNKTSQDINNKPSEDAQTEMARVATKWGTYSGSWNQLTEEQKEAAARLGFAQENQTSNSDFNDKLSAHEKILNQGQELEQQLQGLTSTNDPNGAKARSWLAVNSNDLKNQFSGSLPFGWDKAQAPDPRLTALRNSYQNFTNAVRAEQTTRPLPAGTTSTESTTGAVGNLWDAELPNTLHQFLQHTGQDMSRLVDTGLANHYRMDAGQVLKANASHWGDSTPGASAQMPIAIRNAADKANADKNYPGAWRVDSLGLPYRPLPKAQPAN
jgi:hypothetical protein